MARTKKGKRSPGSEYWGKRPLYGCDSGTKGKRIGIKKERAKLSEKLLNEKKTSKIRNN